MNSTIKYVYQLPESKKIELCRIFNRDNKWSELAVKMNQEDMTTRHLERHSHHSNELLKLSGYQDRTVLELFDLLSKMEYHRAMLVLEPFVPPKYKSKINKGDLSIDEGICSWDSTPSVPFNNRQTVSDRDSKDEGFSEGIQIDEARGTSAECKRMDGFEKLKLTGSSDKLPDKMLVSETQKNKQKKNVEAHYEPVAAKNGREEKPLNLFSFLRLNIKLPRKQKDKNKPKQQPKPQVIENKSAQNNASNVFTQKLPDSAIKRTKLKLTIPEKSETEKTKELGEGKGLPPEILESPFSPTVYKTETLDTSLFESASIVQTPLEELEEATNGWDRRLKLGVGACGEVYKGVWRNTQVAIKRSIECGKEEHNKEVVQSILKELKQLNRYRHDNILPIYGFSIGGGDICLIYQYMPNGSLEDRLLSRHKTPLTWAQRLKIATGTARGLQFLHNPKLTLVHGDIKSGNILLDINFEPKIGDFGLAREGPYKHYTCKKSTKIRGTIRYLPPEYLKNKEFSSKLDVYSFGIVLFELATGRWAFCNNRNLDLVDVIGSFNKTELRIIADISARIDVDQIFPVLMDLGKRCTVEKPKERPEMILVLEELEKMSRKKANLTDSLRGSLPADKKDVKKQGYVVPVQANKLKEFSDSPIKKTTAFQSVKSRNYDTLNITDKFVL